MNATDGLGARVLVTGGAGFLGSNLIERIAARGVESVRLERARLDNPAAWRQALAGVDTVFHLAAQTSGYESERDAAADWRANVLPMRILLDTCRDASLRPFIVFAGSATQCGLAGGEIIDESLPDRPVTAYDRHKLEAEKMLEGAVSKGLARGTTLRLANVYGRAVAYGNGDRGVLDKMIQRALHGDALTLFGDGVGRRDYLYVDDAIEGFLAAASGAARTDGRHFVLGTGESRSLAEAFGTVAQIAEELTGHRPAVVRVASPAGISPIEGRDAKVNATRFRDATGWAPHIAFDQGVRRALSALHAAAAAAA